MKKIMLFIILALISGLLFYGVSIFVPTQDLNRSAFHYQIFDTDIGFGYIIVYKGKTLIRQKNIPAIQELKSFCSRDDAGKVANLVIQKLQDNKPPTISQEELMKLMIPTNCLRQP